MKTKILRNIFITVGVLFASAQLLSAGTFTTFDPPGSTFTEPSAITPSGVIIGFYVDASGVTHGFLRTPGGSFTTIDPPGSTFTYATGITPGGIITGWYQGTMGGLDLHGFLRALDGTFTSFDAPPGGFIGGSFFLSFWSTSQRQPGRGYCGNVCLSLLCGARLPADPRRHLHDHRFPGRVFHRAPRHQPGGGDRGRLL